MTAPTIVAIPKIALDQRASMVWTPPSRQSGGVHIHPDMTAFARLPVLTGAAPVVALSVPIEASTGGTRNVCFTSIPAVPLAIAAGHGPKKFGLTVPSGDIARHKSSFACPRPAPHQPR